MRRKPLFVVSLLALASAGLVGCESSLPRASSYAVVNTERVETPRIRMGDRATVERVLRLAEDDSRVMELLTELCETFGTRLTGSTACEDANRWALAKFESWGLENAHLHEWGRLDARFDRLESAGEIVRRVHDGNEDEGGEIEPAYESVRELEFTTLSWTRGTDGPLVAPVVRMPESVETVDAESLRGKWVLVPAFYSDRRGVRQVGYSMRGRHDVRHEIRTGEYDPFGEAPRESWNGTVTFEGAEVPLAFFPERGDQGVIIGGALSVAGVGESEIEGLDRAGDTIRFSWSGHGPGYAVELEIDGETMTGTASGEGATYPLTLEQTQTPDERAATREDDRILARVLEAEPAGFISASSDERVWTTRPNGWRELDPDDLPRDIEVAVRRSDYDYINSRLSDGQEVYARFDLPHRVDRGPIPVYNTIAEIRGSEKPDEVVIVSAHLDSWDGPGSMGTTDNGTGSSVVMEAARLLVEAGARPKRTIRFALWTGEEQGLLGSARYVESLSEAELAKISAVFVDDGGTNYEGGLPAADHMVDYLAAATAPINGRFYSETDGKHLDVEIRPTGRKIRTHGGSDHASFNKVGVPGFFWDEVGRAEYGVGWHTQNDRLDLAIPEYLVQSSACMAITAYNLACAPDLLPREAPEDEAAGAGGETASRGTVSEQISNFR